MPKVTFWSENSKTLLRIKSAGILLFPAALFFIPLDWLKEQHSICLIRMVTGHDCPGCGMTRAILSAMHLRFADAWEFNRLVAIVLPILFIVWVKIVMKDFHGSGYLRKRLTGSSFFH